MSEPLPFCYPAEATELCASCDCEFYEEYGAPVHPLGRNQ